MRETAAADRKLRAEILSKRPQIPKLLLQSSLLGFAEKKRDEGGLMGKQVLHWYIAKVGTKKQGLRI